MTVPTPSQPDGGGSPLLDLDQPAAAYEAVAHASLRLLAGAVDRPLFAQLQRQLAASPDSYPWQEATRALLAPPVDAQQLVQRGLQAQRDWILRGGRETPKPALARRAKGLLARLCAQLLFAVLFAVVLLVALLAVKHRWPELDIYQALDWLYRTFPALRRPA
jgi:hypothetical protein